MHSNPHTKFQKFVARVLIRSCEIKVELKNLPFQFLVINVMKLLVLSEEDRGLNCEKNFNYILYFNITIDTSVVVIAKVNGVFVFHVNN